MEKAERVSITEKKVQYLTPKEYLKQIERLDILIRQREDERKELVKFDGVNGIDYSRVRVQTSPSGDVPFVRAVERIVIIEDEIEKYIHEYVNLKHKIIGEIQGLANDTCTQILYKRYVQFKSFEVIAVEMHYSYDYIRHQHGYALQLFGRKYLHK